MCMYKGYLHFKLTPYRALKMLSEAVCEGICEEGHCVLRIAYMHF
jgi:hypothetical protein